MANNTETAAKRKIQNNGSSNDGPLLDSINAAVKKYADGELKGILEYCVDPIVSSDVIRNPASSVFDSLSTMVLEGKMVKVVSWYDNEWGYSNRCVDLFKAMA